MYCSLNNYSKLSSVGRVFHRSGVNNTALATTTTKVRASQLAQASERVGSLIPASQQG